MSGAVQQPAEQLDFKRILPIIDGLSGANISTAQAAIADSTNEKTRTQRLGLAGQAFGLGFVMGPVIAFIVLAASGQNYQAVVWSAAFFSLLSILLTLFWFDETITTDPIPVSKRRPFSFAAMIEALGRPQIGFLLIVMFFYQIAFGGYEQFFSLFTLTRLGMDARDTSGLFVLAGIFIIVVQGGFVGCWSKQKGDRWLGIVWLLIASFPAALGGGVLQPAVNSLITKSSDKNEVGGMLGISRAYTALPTRSRRCSMDSCGWELPSRFLWVVRYF